jgi:hypothetical protein
MLRVYIASGCPASQISLRLIDRLQARYPNLPLEVVNVSEPGAVVPDEIFGTPIYTWDDRVLFLGNPSEEALVEHVRNLDEHQQ